MSALQSPPKSSINLLALKPLPPVDKERSELEERERRIREKENAWQMEEKRQKLELEKREEEVKKQGQEHEKTRISNETLKQKVRETENELNAFKAKMMLHEVNTVRHANGTKRMIYLTNKDADNITTSERIAKMLHDFELPAYHLVINLISCNGLSVRLDGAKESGKSGGDLLGKSGILDIAETLKAEKDLEQFMEEVVIPMAVEHRALVMCSPSSICSITMAFTRAVKLCREKYGGQLPFTILASTYAVSVHLKTMEPGFEQALKESSETWKRNSDDLEKAVYRYREVEGKQRNLPEHVLGNIGNLTVNDGLTHFIFVEGMDEAGDDEEERRPKMSTGPNTAWVRLLSRISEHLATSTPTIAMCTQESTPTSKTRMTALLKNKVPVLLIDLRRRGHVKPIESEDDSSLRDSLNMAIENWEKNAKELREKEGQRCETWDICTLSHMNSFLKVKKQGGELLKIARSMRGHSITDATKKKERGKKTVGPGTSAQDVFPSDDDIRKVVEAIAIDAVSGKPAKDNEKDELEHLLKDGNLWSCHVDDLTKSKKLFDSLVMSEMVEPVGDKTMVFLSNWQTRKLNEDIEEIGGINRQKGIERLLFALGIEEPKMVINLINCRGLDHIATAGETTKLHQSPVRDKTLVEAQEDELEYFMKKVVIPVAAQRRALVICDTSTTCSMSMAFTGAVGQLMQTKTWLKEDVDKNRGKLPFSILGTTYGNSVHKTASDPRGQDFVSEVFKASRVWKKSDKLLSEAIENFKSEGKLPQFILDNLGRLSVSDQLSRYIFVDGMEMKLDGNGKMVPTLQTGQDTPWVHMINKIITHYVSLYDSICLCTQEPGGTSNARLKTFLNVSEGCEAKSGNRAILLIDLRKRDEDMLVKRDANQYESTSDKDREKNLLAALAQWQEDNHERVFPSSKAEQNNVMYAEKWDYCTMAYFRGFLVSEKRRAGAEVVFEDKFPKKEHFEKVAEVMVHQRMVEDLAFRIRKGLDDTNAKKKECGDSIEKLKADKADKKVDELKSAKEELEKHKQRITHLESLQKKLKDWSGKRPKNDLGAKKFKDLADELKKAAEERNLWDESKDGKGIQTLRGDISLILSSKSVSACLINNEQRQKDNHQFKQNHELFNKIIGNKAPPKALQSGMSVVQLDRSATGKSSFQTLAGNSVSDVDNSERDNLPEGPCRLCRERMEEQETHESQSEGQTDALAVAALDNRKNSSSTCEIM